MSRFNVFSIIVAHVKTLRKISPNRPDWTEIFVSFGLPAVVSSLLLWKTGIEFEKYISDLLATISIVGGFLFTLLALVYGIIEKIRENPSSSAVRTVFAKEIHANISFSIILSIFCCCSLLIFKISMQYNDGWYDVAKQIILWLNYYLLGVFLLTLIFVLKRIYDLMTP